MPKISPKIILRLNLLRPQSNPEKISVRVIHWLLSSGRFIIVLVELLVLAAFVGRFKLDADLSSTQEAIDNQLPYIESMKADELLIRQTQLQLATIKSNTTSADYAQILKEIGSQTPMSATITYLNLEKKSGLVEIKITGSAQSSAALSTFVNGLKSDKNFSNVNLASLALDQGMVNFSITCSSSLVSGRKL